MKGISGKLSLSTPFFFSQNLKENQAFYDVKISIKSFLASAFWLSIYYNNGCVCWRQHIKMRAVYYAQQQDETLHVTRHPKWQTFVESSDEMWLDKNNCFHNRWRQHRDEIIHQYPLIQWQGEQRTHWPIRGLTASHRNIILQFTHETWITLYMTCSCLSSHWSRQIMWPEYSPLIGQLPWPRGFWLAAESQNNKHWWGERRNNRKQFMTEDYLWICLA